MDNSITEKYDGLLARNEQLEFVIKNQMKEIGQLKGKIKLLENTIAQIQPQNKELKEKIQQYERKEKQEKKLLEENQFYHLDSIQKNQKSEKYGIWIDRNIGKNTYEFIQYLKEQLHLLVEICTTYEQFQEFVKQEDQKRQFILILTPQICHEKYQNQSIKKHVLYRKEGLEQALEADKNKNNMVQCNTEQELFHVIKEYCEKDVQIQLKDQDNSEIIQKYGIWIDPSAKKHKQYIKTAEKKFNMKIQPCLSYQKFKDFLELNQDKQYILIFTIQIFQMIENDSSGPSQNILDYILFHKDAQKAQNFTENMHMVNQCKHCQDYQGLNQHLHKYCEQQKN